MPIPPSARRHLLALLLFALLSLVLTYPLALHFTGQVPGDGIDDPALAWNLWWVKFSLVDQQANPFFSRWMFYPIGINLAFYTLTLLNGLLSVPLQGALGLVTASNLVLLSSFVLGGYGAYLLAVEVLGKGVRGEQRSQRAQGVQGSQGAQRSQGVQEASRSTPEGVARSGQGMPGLHWAALVAGLFYAFSSSKLFYVALGQFNVASSQWIPFTMLYVLRSGRPGASRREPLMAALFLLLQAYAELTFASFLAIFFALYLVFQAILNLRSRLGNFGSGSPTLPNQYSKFQVQDPTFQILPFLVIVLVVLVGLTPVLANMLPDMRAEGDFLVEGGGFADLFSADLAGFALPTQLHPLLGNLIRTAANDSQAQADGSLWQVNKGQHLTLGVVGLSLALAGLWHQRRRSAGIFWGLAALVFFLLTLGPTVRIAGHDTGIPGPFQIVQQLPFFKGNRYPSRYSVMLLASLVPLVGLGAQWLLNRSFAPPSRRRPLALAGLLAIGILFENLSVPLPTTDLQVPSIYATIAADPLPGAVLDLPLGWRNGFNVFGKQDVIIMFEQWWQTEHGKPILGGNTSRNPEYKFRYFLEAPLIGALSVLGSADDAHPHIRSQLAGALVALEAGDPVLGGNALLQEAAASAPQVLADLNITYLVIHRQQAPQQLVDFVEQFLPVERLAADGGHLLYRVRPTVAPAARTLWPARDALSRGEGWSGQPGRSLDYRWAQRRQTRLLVPPLQPGAYRVTVRAAAAGPDQTLALSIAGYRSPRLAMGEGWQELVFDLPNDLLGHTVGDLRLTFGKTVPVTDVMAEELLGTRGPSLLVESAGLEAGNYAHIWLNGRDVSLGGRGYNVALIDQESGQEVATASFDTHGDPGASAAMAAFLQQIDAHHLVAVAVKDTPGDLLGSEGVQALARLGLSDLQEGFRWSQAAIIANPLDLGEPASQVSEVISGLGPAQVSLGAGWTEHQVAAAVAWIRFERLPD